MYRTTPRQSRAVSVNGPALRAIRQALGIAVADITAALDCDASTISKLETGARPRCSPLFLASLVRVLGIEDRRALLACPYGEEAHEQATPAHEALADDGPRTVELERPEVGGEVPRVVATPRLPAPELVPEPRRRPPGAAASSAVHSGRRSSAKHRAGTR